MVRALASQHSLGGSVDIFSSESELLEQLLKWRRCAKPVMRNHRPVQAHVPVPTLGRARFDGHALADIRGQHLRPILRRLLLK